MGQKCGQIFARPPCNTDKTKPNSDTDRKAFPSLIGVDRWILFTDASQCVKKRQKQKLVLIILSHFV